MPLKPLLLAGTIALSAISAPLSAQSVKGPSIKAPETLPITKIPYQKFVLPNGLTLIVNEDHRAPIATVQVWYHVGSANETPRHTGFAHLFEHLMFNGSENFNDEYFRAMNVIGASGLNGTTSFDRTNYFETVPVSALDRTLWLESDRMGHLLGAIDQAKLDEQRGVVENEKRQGELSPMQPVAQMVQKATYPAGHPYSWAPIGSIEDLNAATLDDVQSWFKKWYGAANVTLVIAGDVDPDIMKHKVQRYFGDIASGPPLIRQTKWIAKMVGKRRGAATVELPVDQLFKVWNIPGFDTDQSDYLSAAADVLGGNEDSRLYRRLVKEEGLALNVTASAGANVLGGQFSIQITAKPGADFVRIDRIIGEEMNRLFQDGPTKEEIDRIKYRDYASWVKGTQSLASKASYLGQYETYTGSPDHMYDSLKNTLGMTPAVVQASARTWLSDGSYTLDIRSKPTTNMQTAGVDRSKLPPVGPAHSLQLPPLEHFTLSNGLTVALAQRHDSPTVSMQFLFDAGFAADRTNTIPGSMDLLSGMFGRGTTTRSPEEVRRLKDILGLSFGIGSDSETTTVTFDAITAQLEPSIELFAEALLHPIYPADELARLKNLEVTNLQASRATASGKASRVLSRELFGESHPYAQFQTEAGIQSVTADTLKAYRKRWFRPDNATLLVVGDTDPETIRPLLERYFGNWAAVGPKPVKSELPSVAVPSKPSILLIDQPGSSQSVIVAGYLAPKRSDPDYDAMDTVANVLGGGFLSRLNLNLREDKHWSYGAHAAYKGDYLIGTFALQTSVQTDKTAESLSEMVKEMNDISTDRPPTTAELKVAEDAELLPLPAKLSTASGAADFYAEQIKYGLPEDYWNGFVSRVRALKPAEFTNGAHRLFHPDKLTWVIAGDLSEIEGPIRKLGFSDVSVVDANGNEVR